MTRCDALQKRLGKLNDLETATRLAAELSDNGHLDLAPLSACWPTGARHAGPGS